MKYMKNEEAVSPVIGVILMVVITVIIAAVLAVFAFGVGAPEKDAPSAALKITAASAANGITITHGGGDSILIADMQALTDIDDVGTAPATDDSTAARAGVIDIVGGANLYFDPGETMTFATGSTMVAGNIVKVTILDAESGKPILDATARTTA